MFDVCVRFSVFVLSCVEEDALRRADHPSKESYRLWMMKKLRNQPHAPKVEQAPKWEQRGRKKIKHSTWATRLLVWWKCNLQPIQSVSAHLQSESTAYVFWHLSFLETAGVKLHAGTRNPSIPRTNHVKRVIPSWHNNNNSIRVIWVVFSSLVRTASWQIVFETNKNSF
jgi:hypothetical protein